MRKGIFIALLGNLLGAVALAWSWPGLWGLRGQNRVNANHSLAHVARIQSTQRISGSTGSLLLNRPRPAWGLPV